MKHLLAAAACAPLLIACASAGAQTAQSPDEDREDRRVLIINGERIELNGDGDAGLAIRQALREGEDNRRIVIELDGDNEFAFFSDGEMTEFAEAMEGIAVFIGEGFGEHFEFDFDEEFEFDFDGDFDFDFDEDVVIHFEGEGMDEDAVRIHVERAQRHAERAARHAERHAERAAELAERHAERAARHAERMAARIEIQALQAERMGERMAVRGLEAGVRGMERGIEGIDRVLERGWYEDNGERVELTDEKRAELEETRAELAEDIVDLRADLEELRGRLGAHREHREIRIERRDGSVRGWLNGREVTGSELDALLEGAPDAPEPPEAPDAP